MKQIDKNNWCIEITKNNKETVQKIIGLPTYAWTIGAYYGMRSGEAYGHGNSFTNEISEEEFNRFILNESINDYEIY